ITSIIQHSRCARFVGCFGTEVPSFCELGRVNVFRRILMLIFSRKAGLFWRNVFPAARQYARFLRRRDFARSAWMSSLRKLRRTTGLMQKSYRPERTQFWLV